MRENAVDVETLTRKEQEIILKFLKGKKEVRTEDIRALMKEHLEKFKLFEYCIVIHSRDYFSVQRPLGL